VRPPLLLVTNAPSQHAASLWHAATVLQRHNDGWTALCFGVFDGVSSTRLHAQLAQLD
jgi:hypothetical protein